jgi:hypothetical protein
VKRLGWYLVYGVVLIVLSLWLTKHAEELRIMVSRTYKPAGYIVYNSIYPVLIGMLLSVPGLYSNIRQEGRISLDWTRLGAVGIPALALTLSQILYWFTPIGRIIAPVLPGWGLVKDIVVVGGIILGYTLLSSIRKVPHTHEVSKTL